MSEYDDEEDEMHLSYEEELYNADAKISQLQSEITRLTAENERYARLRGTLEEIASVIWNGYDNGEQFEWFRNTAQDALKGGG